MSQPKLEVADIFRRHGEAWRTANAGHVSLAQRRVMTAIEICRTATLGGHVERCEDCAHMRIAYNSQSALQQVSMVGRSRMARSAQGGTAASPLLPCGIHCSGKDP